MSSQAKKIIVVEDDGSVRDAIVGYLAMHGYHAVPAKDGRELDSLLANEMPDLVVLDIMLPGENGLSICQRLLASGPPVLMLSALGDTADRIVGLEIGAADYLSKPFDPRELLARIRSVLRRDARPETSRACYRFDGWLLEEELLQLTAPNGHVVRLTAGELKMLLAFVTHPMRVLSRDALVDLTHEIIDGPFDRAVDLAVSRLRRRLASHGGESLIETVRGFGYRWRAAVVRR
ncbi:response regulator [Dyella mobilis]|uniref:response regulator n=1 Tax=Dyella mobilis TaxID=1849582 RepID=UPI00235C93CF|nr:response regulator [Dyella mobilis]GLQ98121.1 DNA-binding response regulator [Dyella mobilis]